MSPTSSQAGSTSRRAPDQAGIPGRFRVLQVLHAYVPRPCTRHEDEACPKVYCGLCKESCPNCVSDSDEETARDQCRFRQAEESTRTAAAMELAWEKTIAKDLARRKLQLKRKQRRSTNKRRGRQICLSSTNRASCCGDTASADKSNSAQTRRPSTESIRAGTMKQPATQLILAISISIKSPSIRLAVQVATQFFYSQQSKS